MDNISNTTIVSLKEFFETKLVLMQKLLETKLASLEKTHDVAASELARRLEKFPEQYMTKLEYEKAHEKVKSDLERVLIDVSKKIGPNEIDLCKDKLESLRSDIQVLKAKEGATAKIITISVSLTTIAVALIAIVTHAIFAK